MNSTEQKKKRRLYPAVLLLLGTFGLILTAVFLWPGETAGQADQSGGIFGLQDWTLRLSGVQEAQEETDPPAEETPQDILTGSWQLRLVNGKNPLPEDYQITVTELEGGQAVDQRCYPDLMEMMDDCRAAGLSPMICSSYRTWETQETLYQNKVTELQAQGSADPEGEAGTIVAVPGTSEHQLGLALDIVDVSNQNLDETQEDTAVQKWLMENSWKYGFILRYPVDKSDITGIIYEPWHYRYVGKEAAREIFEAGVCLEEYLGAE